MRRIWAAAAILLLVISPAHGTLRVYEPFDYPAGSFIADQPASGVNLTGLYTTTSVLELSVQSPGLNYGALAGAPAVAANRLSQTVGTAAGFATVAVDQDVEMGADTATFFSTLFTFDDSTNGNRLANVTFTDDATGDLIFFGEAAVGAQHLRVAADTDAIGQLVAAGADGAFTNGQTLLLLGRYVNSAAPDADSLHLVGYDTADAITLPTDFDPADPNAQFAYALTGLDIDMSTISSITFTIRGDANNFIDELRLGSTYAAVIPEPAGTPLVLGFVAAAIARSRRRSR